MGVLPTGIQARSADQFCHLLASLLDVTRVCNWVGGELFKKLTGTNLGTPISGKPDIQALCFSLPPAPGSTAAGLAGETSQALATLWSSQTWTAQVCASLWEAAFETQLISVL